MTKNIRNRFDFSGRGGSYKCHQKNSQIAELIHVFLGVQKFFAKQLEKLMRNRNDVGEYSITKSCWNFFLIYKTKTRRFSIENRHSHWFSEVKVEKLKCSFLSALWEKRKVHCYCSDFVSAFVKRADYSKDLKKSFFRVFSALCAFVSEVLDWSNPYDFRRNRAFCMHGGTLCFIRHFSTIRKNFWR